MLYVSSWEGGGGVSGNMYAFMNMYDLECVRVSHINKEVMVCTVYLCNHYAPTWYPVTLSETWHKPVRHASQQDLDL